MKKISVASIFILCLLFNKTHSQSISRLHEIIDSAYDEENYEYVIKKCDAVLATRPTDSIAILRKTSSLYYAHRIEDCISFAEKSFHPADSAATMLGILSLQDDERSTTDSALVFADREKVVTASLRLSSNNAYALLGRSLLDAEQKNFDIALQHITDAVSSASDNIKPGFRVVKASLYFDFLKDEEGIAEMNSIIKDYPDFERAYEQLVRYYRSVKKYQEALDALKMHSDHFDKEAEDADIKFYILKNWGKTEEACELAQKIGDDFNYVKDAAGDMGCPWLGVHLNNNLGAEYTYSVTFDGNDYDFIVTRTKGDYSSDLSFDWRMTTNDEMSGSITLTKKALDDATEQMNKFSYGMGQTTLEDKTTVWISRAAYNALKENGTATLNVDGMDRDFKVATEEQEDNYEVDYYNGSVTYNGEEDKRIKTIHIYSDDDDKYQLWINDDASNPMIIKMMIDFDIELKEVKE